MDCFFLRYVCQLQRVTIKFCKSQNMSAGVREYIETEMVDFARANPGIVIYLKPRRHKAPVLISEYLNGQSHHLAANNFTPKECSMWLEFLRDRAGNEVVAIKKQVRTAWPSTQGVWTPFTNRPYDFNIKSFPIEEKSRVHEHNYPWSATEQLLRIYKESGVKNILIEEDEEEGSKESKEEVVNS